MFSEYDTDIFHCDRVDIANPDIARGLSSIITYPIAHTVLPWVNRVYDTMKRLEEDGISPFEIDPDELLDKYGGRSELEIFDKVKSHTWCNYEKKSFTLTWNAPLNVFLKDHNLRAAYVEYAGPHKGHMRQLMNCAGSGSFSYNYLYLEKHHANSFICPETSGLSPSNVVFSTDKYKKTYDIGYCHMVAHWLLAFENSRSRLLTHIVNCLAVSGKVFLSFPDYDSLRVQSEFSHDDGWMELIEFQKSTDPKLPSMFKTRVNGEEYTDPYVNMDELMQAIKAVGLRAVTYGGTEYLRIRGFDKPLPHLKSVRVIEITKDILPLTPVISRSGLKKKEFKLNVDSMGIPLFPEAKGRPLLREDMPWLLGDTWWCAEKIDGISARLVLKDGLFQVAPIEKASFISGGFSVMLSSYSGPPILAYAELFQSHDKDGGIAVTITDVYEIGHLNHKHSFLDRWTELVSVYNSCHELKSRCRLQQWQPLDQVKDMYSRCHEGVVLINISASYGPFPCSAAQTYPLCGPARYIKRVYTKDVRLEDLGDIIDHSQKFKGPGVYEVTFERPYRLIRSRNKVPNEAPYLEMLQRALSLEAILPVIENLQKTNDPYIYKKQNYPNLHLKVRGNLDQFVPDLELLSIAATFPREISLFDCEDESLITPYKVITDEGKMFLKRLGIFRAASYRQYSSGDYDMKILEKKLDELSMKFEEPKLEKLC